MELIESNIGWTLLLITVLFIFLYKKFSNNQDALTSRFEARKKIDSDLSSSLIIVRKALVNSGFHKVGIDESENRFYAQTKISMSSWSEYIEVVLNYDREETKINFKSICAMPVQIFAWGKNKRNYKRFEKELKKLMPIT